MERRFRCTSCGKCCRGWLPLTLGDAMAQAHRFPLAMVWTPVRESSPQFELALDLGLAVPIDRKKRIAVLIVPTVYLPPAFPCPALTPDHLCGLQAEKPLRCRTMPLSPYREETGQDDLLQPREGWLCDTSDAAPLLYKDRTIIDRADFDRERETLRQDAPVLRTYGEKLLKTNAGIAATLAQTARNPKGGHFVLAFSSFLRFQRDADLGAFARAQRPVLLAYQTQTETDPALAPYHAFYRDNAIDLAWYAQDQKAETLKGREHA